MIWIGGPQNFVLGICCKSCDSIVKVSEKHACVLHCVNQSFDLRQARIEVIKGCQLVHISVGFSDDVWAAQFMMIGWLDVEA